jgi:hypothetical protein
MFIHEPVFLWWVIASSAVLTVALRGFELYFSCQDRSEEWERLYRIEERLKALENKEFRP